MSNKNRGNRWGKQVKPGSGDQVGFEGMDSLGKNGMTRHRGSVRLVIKTGTGQLMLKHLYLGLGVWGMV